MNFIQYKLWLKSELFKIYQYPQNCFLQDLCFFFDPSLSLHQYLTSNHQIKKQVFKKTKKYLIYLQQTKLPIPYLLCFTYFDNLKIFLNKKTFIPRSNSLEMAYILKKLINIFSSSSSTLIDLCSGSCALGFFFKKHFQSFKVICFEKNKLPIKAALKTKNDQKLEIEIYQSNLLKLIKEKQIKFQFLICNPPYIDYHEKISQVLEHEPRAALFNNKIEVYQKIFKQLNTIKNLILDPFFFIFEINFNFKELLIQDLKKYQSFQYYYFLRSKISNQEVFLLISSFKLNNLILEEICK